jgi:ATP-dependent DNA ligase
LQLGYYRGGRLVYAGKVGTGFDQATRKLILDRSIPYSYPFAPYRQE